MPAAVRAHLAGHEAGTGVAHLGDQLVALHAQPGLRLVHVGVLDDVEQGLLEEAVHGHRGDQRERVRLLRPGQPDGDQVAQRELAPQRADRGGEVAVAQLGRPGAGHQRPDLLLSLLDQAADPGDPVRLRHRQVVLAQQRPGHRQRLGDRVVQLGGQLAAGGLLRRDQTGQQLEHARAGVLRGAPGLLGELVGDPGPQVQRVQHPGQVGQLGARGQDLRPAGVRAQRRVPQPAYGLRVQRLQPGRHLRRPQHPQHHDDGAEREADGERKRLGGGQPVAGEHQCDRADHPDDRRDGAERQPDR